MAKKVFLIDQAQAGYLLVICGPSVWVEIGHDPSEGQATERVLALIDTGATEGHIDRELAERLGLSVTGRHRALSPEGLYESDAYAARVVVPSTGITLCGRFGASRLTGQRHQVILGRTFLANVTMTYDGVTGQVTLTRHND